ncbi:MAG: glutaredoxin family protein [Candidatus Aminicenantes bacterium]|nr:glutaredoxin family protein [Candidatus Aminicenantes bacterium]
MNFVHVEGQNKGKKVILYAISTCVWCQRVKELLKNLKIDYTYVDVDLASGDDKKQLIKEVKRWNPALSFPTLIIDDKIVVIGYNPEEIRSRLFDERI